MNLFINKCVYAKDISTNLQLHAHMNFLLILNNCASFDYKL